MYQTIIRDPGGNSPVRLISNERVVDGSLLIVPGDTEAFFVCNGITSNRYPSGRYEIYTGVDPFFVRFRNLMTRGDPGITCQVFFVNKRFENCIQGGTGDIIFQAKHTDDIGIPVRAKAAFTMRYTICDPAEFISRLVGMHNNYFYTEDIQPAINSMILPAIKEAIVSGVSGNNIYEIQSGLTGISNIARNRLVSELLDYGMALRAIAVTSVNISEADMARFVEQADMLAKGKLNTEIEGNEINTIYGGDVNRRITEEFLTGTYRGTARPLPARNGAQDISDIILKYPIMREMAPLITRPLRESVQDTSDNVQGNVTAAGTQPGSAAGPHNRRVPPPLPRRPVTCRSCKRIISPNDTFCKYCGHKN